MAGNLFPRVPVFMLFEWALAEVQGQEEETIPWQHHPQAHSIVTGWPRSEREKMAKGLSRSHDLLFPWAVCTLRWSRSFVAMRVLQPGILGSAPLPSYAGSQPPKESLICGVCQCLWCKYTHQWGFQGANMMFPGRVGPHTVRSLSQYKHGPADPLCPPVFSGGRKACMRTQDPGWRPSSASG